MSAVLGYAMGHEAAVIEDREKLSAFMIARSIPTGHGDTIEALLGELGGWLDGHLTKQPTLEGR